MAGETDGIDLLVAACVHLSGVALVLGCGASGLVDSLANDGIECRRVNGDWPSIQLTERFPVVIVLPDALAGPDEAAVVHCAVQHLLPGGLMATPYVGDADAGSLAERFELQPAGSVEAGDEQAQIHQRTMRPNIHDVVFEARSSIRRVTPMELAAWMQRDPNVLVVDTRTPTDRERFGVIEGSVHVPRTVLEWHLDPANGYRHVRVQSFDQPIVVVCNGGYSSALGAASLRRLGFTDVGDVLGGMRAWVQADLAVVAPDHTHLDL